MTDINDASNQHPGIGPDAGPVTFEVEVVRGGTPAVKGKTTLEISLSGLLIRSRKNELKPMSLSWDNLRELKRRGQRFTANIGIGQPDMMGDKDIILEFWVRPFSKARELDGIFRKLPAEVFARRCPECSGTVIDNVCKNCGKSYSRHQRKRGLLFLLAGSLFLMVGLNLTVASYKDSTGEVIVFFGLIAIGAVLIVFGLIRLIFAVRIS